MKSCAEQAETINGVLPNKSYIPDDLLANYWKNSVTKTKIGLTEDLGHFTLGEYYIDAELLEPHPTQRPIAPSHITSLIQEFTNRGVLQSEYPGVVIGLGEGWMKMKNTGKNPYKITKDNEFLYHLSINNKISPIAQIIWGSHRTEAIKKYAADQEKPEEG